MPVPDDRASATYVRGNSAQPVFQVGEIAALRTSSLQRSDTPLAAIAEVMLRRGKFVEPVFQVGEFALANGRDVAFARTP